MTRYFSLFFCLLTAGNFLLAQPIRSRAYSWTNTPVVAKAGADQRALLEGSTTDFGHLKLHASTVPAHQAPHPAHRHDDEELVIIKEGALTVTIAGKTQTLGPNSLALIMPGDEHGFENNGAEPVTYYVMRYTATLPADAARGKDAGGSFWIDWTDVPFQPHDKGGVRRMFDRATVMTKRFEMHVTTLNGGLWSHAPHTHRAAEILILVGGSAESSINGKLYPVSPGDVLFLESNVPHAIHNNSPQPCMYVAFQFE